MKLKQSLDCEHGMDLELLIGNTDQMCYHSPVSLSVHSTLYYFSLSSAEVTTRSATYLNINIQTKIVIVTVIQ